ncbi:MAG: DNA-binding response regulator [Lachnospiraceae bacterium]|nr:DNA-binding response regulator [Lachnospiraceae bacterium]MBD5525671.1 DNA-binding response regulator [Lachnospiraceae bacterium]
MIKIAICDEKNENINEIERHLFNISARRSIPIDTLSCSNVQELKKVIRQKEYFDLIYINIEMLNEIVQTHDINQVMNDVVVIYISEENRQMTDVYGMNFFAFLIIPIVQQHFETAFLEANRIICRKKVYFHFRYRNEEHKILCSDILYFASAGRLINISLEEGKCDSFYGKLSEVEKEVRDGKIPFLRIHQSYLVNYHHIKACSKTEVTLSDGTKLPISESKQKSFQKQYNAWK